MKKIGKLNFGPRWYGKNANDEVGYMALKINEIIDAWNESQEPKASEDCKHESIYHRTCTGCINAIYFNHTCATDKDYCQDCGKELSAKPPINNKTSMQVLCDRCRRPYEIAADIRQDDTNDTAAMKLYIASGYSKNKGLLCQECESDAEIL